MSFCHFNQVTTSREVKHCTWFELFNFARIKLKPKVKWYILFHYVTEYNIFPMVNCKCNKLAMAPFFLKPSTLVLQSLMQTQLWQNIFARNTLIYRVSVTGLLCVFLDFGIHYTSLNTLTYLYLHVDVFGVKHNTFASRLMHQKFLTQMLT